MNLATFRRKIRLRMRVATLLMRFAPYNQAEAPLHVMTSFPRSGTHWLKHMISHSMGVDPLEKRINTPDVTALIQALETEASHRLIYDHFDVDLHGAVLTPDKYPRLKLILLYRHPLDALISQFYTRAVKGTLSDPSLTVIENVKLYLLNQKPQNNTVPLREYVRRRVIGWLETGYCLPVRYEDLVQDASGQLARVLDYLEVSAATATIKSAVEQNQFQVLSGGRQPGEVDPKSHYRRGIPGEWRDALTTEELAVIEQQIGDYLQLLGYPSGRA